jgi:hypothetical protein
MKTTRVLIVVAFAALLAVTVIPAGAEATACGEATVQRNCTLSNGDTCGLWVAPPVDCLVSGI